MRIIHKIIVLMAMALPYACQEDGVPDPTLEMSKMPVSIGMTLDKGFADDTSSLTSRVLTPGEILAEGEVPSVQAFSFVNSTLLKRASLFCPAMRDADYRHLAAYTEADSTLSFKLWDAANMNTASFIPYLYHLDSKAVQRAYLYVRGESTSDNGVIDMLEGSADRVQNHFHFDLKHAGSKMTVIMNVINTDESTKITQIGISCSRYYPSYRYTTDGTTFKDISEGNFSQATDMCLEWTKNTPESDILLTPQTGSDVPENLYNTLLYPQSLKGEYIYVTVNRPKGDVLYSIMCDSIHLVGDELSQFTSIERGKHVVITLTMDLNELLTGYAAVSDWYDAKAISPVDGSNVLEGVGLDSAAVNDIDYLAAENVFRIYTPKGLMIFRNIVNATNTLVVPGYPGEYPPNNMVDANGKLMRDLDMSTNKDTRDSWAGIGSSTAQAFRGNFDGCGFSISNLKFTKSSHRGLFFCVGDGLDDSGNKKRIENIVFKDVLISPTESYAGSLIGQNAKNYVISNISVQGSCPNLWATGRGGIAGHVDGLVDFENCTVDIPMTSATAKDKYFDAPSHIGGIVGYISSAGECTFTNCLVRSKLEFRKDCSFRHVGGLIGRADSPIVLKNCNCEGLVTGDQYVGGLVGSTAKDVEMSNCYMKQSVEIRPCVYHHNKNGEADTEYDYYATSVSFFGGLIGYVTGNASITDCAMLGDKVESTMSVPANYVGGLIGYVKGNLLAKNTYCIASYIESGNYGGGIVAQVEGSVEMDNVYATTQVYSRVEQSETGYFLQGTTGNYMGGLIGMTSLDAKISNSYATGNVSGIFRCGGLVGYIAKFAQISNCHASGNISVSEGTTYLGCYETGGLIGRLDAGLEITDSYSEGNIEGNKAILSASGSEVAALGGLVGYITEGTTSLNNSAASNKRITNCYALGSVSCTYGSYVGGLLGYSASYIHISNCAAGCNLAGGQSQTDSSVKAVYGSMVGGLVGYGCGSIVNCKVAHNVYANGSRVGGIAGYWGNDAVACDDRIASCHVSGCHVYGMHSVGGIVGMLRSYAEVEDCSSSNNRVGYYKLASGEIRESTTSEGVGGLIGQSYNYITVSNCHAESEVFGRWQSGGLIGCIGQHSEIIDCYATGNVTTDVVAANMPGFDPILYSSCGGLVGRVSDGWTGNSHITNCYATGNVKHSALNAGGLIGFIGGSSEVLDCYATGQVTSSGERTGGLIGYVRSINVKKCYVTGNVEGTSYSGGLIGFADQNLSLLACRAEGDVNMKGESSIAAGGLVGYVSSNAIIVGSCSKGSRVIAEGKYIGGLIGYKVGTMMQMAFCYSLTSVVGEERVGGLLGYSYDARTNEIYSCYAIGRVSGDKNFGALIGYNGNGNMKYLYNCASSQHEGITYGIGYSGVTNVANTDWGVAEADIRNLLVTGSTFSYEINGTTYTAETIWSHDVTPKLPW